jgi:hypothetical protein
MADPVDAATEATLRWWRQPDRYGALLLLLILNYLAALLVGGSTGGQGPILLLTILSLLLALHTSEVRGRVVAFAFGACGVAVVVAAVEAARNEARASAVVSMVVGLLLLVTPATILRRILGHHRIVSTETLAAALCTYLLIGLAFANLYAAVDAWDVAAFTDVDAGDRLSDLVYFSFVTLTTVGFGDIVPKSDLARSMAVTEALMGQIVLVTFVGRIVGLMAAPARRVPLANMHEVFEEEVEQADADPDADSEADPDAGPP